MVLAACVGLGLLLAAGRETKPAPKPLDEWRQVQRLEPGSEVEVVLRQGPSLKGLFARVDGDRLRILTFDNAGYSGNVRQTMLSIAASRLEYPVHLEVGGKHFTLDSVLQHVMRDEVHLVRRPLHHSAGKALGIVLGIPLGAVLGAIVGSKLEGDCRCDDPGLTGMIRGGLVGIPLGALFGGLLGAKADREGPPFETVYHGP
jgi:hypothetical protein